MYQVPLELKQRIEEQPWSDPYWEGDIPVCSGIAVANIGPFKKNEKGYSPLLIWEMPRPLSRYTLAIDPSIGKEFGDPAAIQVVDSSGIQVAEMILRGIGLEGQCLASFWLGYLFNEAWVVVEVNSFGSVLFDMLHTHRYPKLWYENGTRPGWTTTIRTRDAMIIGMQKSLLDERPMMKSRRLKEELNSFCEGGSEEDDLLMAMAIAYHCK